MNFTTPLLVIFSIAWICAILASNWRARRSSKLPPGPYQFPIIGNLLSVGSEPHRSLAKLSRKYGGLMLVKLGSVTTVVVSSPETAKLVMQKHDLVFSRRTVLGAATPLKHHESSMVWLPVGKQWRRFRRISKELLLSEARLDANQGLRREKLQGLREYVEECCEAGRAVDVGGLVFTTMMNMMAAALFSMGFGELGSDSSHQMEDVVNGIMKGLVAPNIADSFPLLKSVDPQGIVRKSRVYFEKMFQLFDEIIEERLKSNAQKNDLLQALLHLNGGDEPDQLSLHDIKHILVDILAGGVDTSTATIEWAMTRLIRSPTKMSTLRNEVTKFIKENEPIQESDILRLPYLQAVVKETFRLHPAAPMLVPRKATADVEIGNYVVPKDAQVMINAWAIGRDPSMWAESDEFVPERFLNKNRDIDYSGQHFELLPFGSGRRICPGLPLAERSVHQIVATLVANFDWKLQTQHQIDFTLQRAPPLIAIPNKF